MTIENQLWLIYMVINRDPLSKLAFKTIVTPILLTFVLNLILLEADILHSFKLTP